MRITKNNNINETIREKKTEDKIVYGDWWFDGGSNEKGSNMPNFICTMTNVVTNISTTFKCPFSTRKKFIEDSMMRVIKCYNELVDVVQLKKNHNIDYRTTLQPLQEHKLMDALYDYIKDKYSDKYYFDDFNFNKKFKREETYIYVDFPSMLDKLKVIKVIGT